MKQKYLFIDRDGTLIEEPVDEQVNSFEKLALLPQVILALSQLTQAGYKLIIITNQDGLGTAGFPEETFIKPHELMLQIFQSQGIIFDGIHICPHFAADHCDCRKPKVGLLMDYLRNQTIDKENSFVIGDRDTDLELANNLGISGIKIKTNNFPSWREISEYLLRKPRIGKIARKTKETEIIVQVNLDDPSGTEVKTGIGFFDHMLEQIAKHGQIGLKVAVRGDLHIDEHHTVEDTAICLGQALKQAIGDKYGINRYGFLLPLDEALAEITLDLSGRAYCGFSANFTREKVGDLPTELVPHFFRSVSENLAATLHIKLTGENTHHMIEAGFKAFAKVLNQAVKRSSKDLPSTKGLL